MNKKISVLASAFLMSSFLFAQGVGVGTRINLTSQLQLNTSAGQFAQIFVPDYFSPPVDGGITLVFHLHSASWAAEDEVYKSETNAVLFNIHLGGFSSSYQNYFSNQNKFQTILNLVLSNLSSHNIIEDPNIENLIVTSFSAGYAGVREVFKVSSYYNSIDALLLADGLHCSSNSASMQIQMQDFVKFAKHARDLNKVMILTHSSITTSGYESTTQTADYLIGHIGAVRESCNINDIIGTRYSKCDTGNFHLRGYHGLTAEDHLKHLYAMNLILEQAVDILGIETASIEDDSPAVETFLLSQNFPNPFNPSTTIDYKLENPGYVELCIYDLCGRVVKSLFRGFQNSGDHSVIWNASGLPSGVYMYSILTEDLTSSKRCIKLK